MSKLLKNDIQKLSQQLKVKSQYLEGSLYKIYLTDSFADCILDMTSSKLIGAILDSDVVLHDEIRPGLFFADPFDDNNIYIIIELCEATDSILCYRGSKTDQDIADLLLCGEEHTYKRDGKVIRYIFSNFLSEDEDDNATFLESIRRIATKTNLEPEQLENLFTQEYGDYHQYSADEYEDLIAELVN